MAIVAYLQANAPAGRNRKFVHAMADTALAAEFAVTVGSLASFSFRSRRHLASYAGLAPVPRDSGRRTGNLHRPQRYSRRLRRVLYLSAMPA